MYIHIIHHSIFRVLIIAAKSVLCITYTCIYMHSLNKIVFEYVNECPLILTKLYCVLRKTYLYSYQNNVYT